MRIVLINPPSCVDIPPYPPLGLGFIAAYLGDHGVDVKIVDLNIEVNYKKRDITNIIKDIVNHYNVVGISLSYTCTAPTVFHIAKIIKEINENSIIILGGAHATFDYKNILSRYNEVIDFIVRGEGEETFYELIYNLHKTCFNKIRLKDFKRIKGIAFRLGQEIVVTEPRKPIENLDLIPKPWQYLNLEAYRSLTKITIINTTRGCPFNCIYCAAMHFWGKTIRYFSIERVIDDIIELIEKYRFKSIVFMDDTFNLNRKRVIQLCTRLLEEKIDIDWYCSARADLIDEELLKIMGRCGCRKILYGIESADPKIQRIIGKNLDLEKAAQAVIKTRFWGIKVTESFILGLPNESHESIKRNIEFIKKTVPDDIAVHFLVPYPGTYLYEHLEMYGLRKVLDDYTLYTSYVPVVVPKGLTPLDLIKAKITMIQVLNAIRNLEHKSIDNPEKIFSVS